LEKVYKEEESVREREVIKVEKINGDGSKKSKGGRKCSQLAIFN
jgi:hypothetical protein